MTVELDGDDDLEAAFRGLGTGPGAASDIRRTVLNQRDRLIGAEAELGTARREIKRLEQELAATKAALRRARTWPFGWVRQLLRRAVGVLRRAWRDES